MGVSVFDSFFSTEGHPTGWNKLKITQGHSLYAGSNYIKLNLIKDVRMKSNRGSDFMDYIGYIKFNLIICDP